MKEAADQAGIDWRELAAAAKATTNLSTNYQQAFPLPQAIAKSSVLINTGKTNFNSDEALLTAAKFIKANRTSDNEPDWDAITKKLNPGIEDHDREHLAAKSSYYNTRCQADNGVLPVTKIAKDWNELAKLAQHQEPINQQLEKTYRRQDGKTAKLIANGQDQFSLVDRQQPDKVVGFFEANDPQQCAYLIKQYGYNAVDKEDEQKYQQTQPVKPQQQHKKQRAAGLEQSM
ncbi:LtrC-like protein [Lacticaseibacillus paracasei subsp. paracasei Lpp226]|nr:LtrC-like protein [Lacticaseibacillus paracasei subsp. paracasei Lpp226]